MKLSEKQRIFTKLVAQLILWSYENGYELTFGQTTRSEKEAAANAAAGSGISRSNHLIRLAVDLNLFIDGEYRTRSEDYKPLGEFWKSLSQGEIICCWGGDFHKPDGNHFSLEHEGVK